VPLPCVYRGARQKVPFIAVRFSRRRTAKIPVCRAFFRQAHGKEPMFAVRFAPGARQRVSHAVWRQCRQLLFLPCVVKKARQRLSTVRCQTWRTTKGLYCVKCYHAPFAVRPDEKGTAKRLPCVLWPLHGKAAVSGCVSGQTWGQNVKWTIIWSGGRQMFEWYIGKKIQL
jgi:hypothetical protein